MTILQFKRLFMYFSAMGQEPDRIYLNVPFRDKDEAKRLGAKWDALDRGWWITSSALGERFEQWLPHMFRENAQHPFIVSEMVPAPCWYINLRSLLPAEPWQRLRRECAERAGNRCEICGGRGQKWPVECDEQWLYIENPATPGIGIQKLFGLTALCPTCHSIKHLGKARVEGRYPSAIAQLSRVNGWTLEQSEAHAEQAFYVWERRSAMQWTLDLTCLFEELGFGQVFVNAYRMNPLPLIEGIDVVVYPTCAMLFNNRSGAAPFDQSPAANAMFSERFGRRSTNSNL